MKKSTIIVIIISALLVFAAAGAFVVTNNAKNEVPETPTATEPIDHTGMDHADESAETTKQGQEAKQTSEVTIENFAYTPATITVKKGTTVTWTNKDDVRHDVASDDNVFKSELLAKGESFSFTFDEAGSFKYHCSPHPNMIGTVIVE